MGLDYTNLTRVKALFQPKIEMRPVYLPFLSSYDPNQPRNVELHLDIGERMLVGIPSSRQLTWWNAHKAE